MTALSQRAEFVFVILAAFGLFIVTSAVELIHVSPRISDHMLRGMLVFELGVGSVLVAFLRRRGWRAASLDSRASLWDPIVGLGLAGLTLLCIAALFSV